MDKSFLIFVKSNHYMVKTVPMNVALAMHALVLARICVTTGNGNRVSFTVKVSFFQTLRHPPTRAKRVTPEIQPAQFCQNQKDCCYSTHTRGAREQYPSKRVFFFQGEDFNKTILVLCDVYIVVLLLDNFSLIYFSLCQSEKIMNSEEADLIISCRIV